MKVKIKKLNKYAVIPSYAKTGDAGLDLTSISREIKEDDNKVIYDTGIAMEIPDGHVGLLFPRSSIHKKDILLANSVGVVDSKYRGPIKLIFRANDFDKLYDVGDRIGQIIIIPYPTIEFEEVDELSDTERGKDGFGSTGK